MQYPGIPLTGQSGGEKLPGMHTSQDQLRRNLSEITRHITQAQQRSTHAASHVTLIAVTKHVDALTTDLAVQTGVTDIGENRIQSALPKFALMRERPRRHLIGSLQTNKVRAALEHFDCIHSLDRMALAHAIQAKQSSSGLPPFPCFLQVNASHEAQKHGFALDAACAAAKDIAHSCSHIALIGLMTMAADGDDEAGIRACFRALREIRDQLVRDGLSCQALSMGMSADYALAVEEGATHVRIGTALFASST